MPTVNGGGKKRIDYIDLIKGITMFGVVWLHSIACPQWLTATLVNSTFFFLSGIFFKTEPFHEFVKKKSRTLLVPFIVFYILCYPYRMIVHYWDFRSLATFDWKCILDIFDICGRSDYLFVNVPLWFILCLFFVQIIYYFISKLNKIAIVLIVLLTIIFKNFIYYDIPTPFMINNACYWVGFFAAGNLCGKFIIGKMEIIRNRIILFIISLVTIFGLCLTNSYLDSDYATDLIYQLKMYAVFGILFSAGSCFDGWKMLSPIRFIGLNSLPMLCMHIPVLIIFGRIFYKITNHNPQIIHGLICTILTCIVCYFLIIFCNKHCPAIVGKMAKSNSFSS